MFFSHAGSAQMLEEVSPAALAEALEDANARDAAAAQAAQVLPVGFISHPKKDRCQAAGSLEQWFRIGTQT
jgi:hypothetical protein